MGAELSPSLRCGSRVAVYLILVVFLNRLSHITSTTVGHTVGSEQSALDAKRISIDHWIKVSLSLLLGRLPHGCLNSLHIRSIHS